VQTRTPAAVVVNTAVTGAGARLASGRAATSNGASTSVRRSKSTSSRHRPTTARSTVYRQVPHVWRKRVKLTRGSSASPVEPSGRTKRTLTDETAAAFPSSTRKSTVRRPDANEPVRAASSHGRSFRPAKPSALKVKSRT